MATKQTSELRSSNENKDDGTYGLYGKKQGGESVYGMGSAKLKVSFLLAKNKMNLVRKLSFKYGSSNKNPNRCRVSKVKLVHCTDTCIYHSWRRFDRFGSNELY